MLYSFDLDVPRTDHTRQTGTAVAFLRSRSVLSTRASVALVAGGAAPFAVGMLLSTSDGQVSGPSVPCPWRDALGIPCPLCGATRAVTLLVHGDGAWTSYNAGVVLTLLALVLAGVVGLAWPAVARRGLRLPPYGAIFAALGVAIVGSWLWAMAHAETILDTA
ncbi:MAG TPA: DUF2752 domain-containing protein [Capillimicrobium sp.]|nr:DUF2752 domain-containing protein [Capillimicrobium sp.]